MSNFKFLIILFYYNRPNLVKNAIRSVVDHEYTNWEVAFIDDGSEVVGEDIVRDIVEDTSKFKFYRSEDTEDIKIERGGENGSMMGMYAQKAIGDSDADYAIMLCDDDALYRDYLGLLNYYYNDNPEIFYSYSHIMAYDPTKEKPGLHLPKRKHELNKTGEIHPYYNLDMSQVSFNLHEYKSLGLSFPYPYTVNIDAELFKDMYMVWGEIPFNNKIGQYKGIYSDNLSHRMYDVLTNDKDVSNVYKVSVK